MANEMFDVIVVGEGISGLTAAGILAQEGFRVATFEQNMFGGLILNVNELRPGPENGPPSGSDLCAALMEANADAGVTSIQEQVTGIAEQADLVEVSTSAGRHTARHVILASGARLRKLGVPGETKFEGRGVSSCADCDGPMNVGTDVLVVGGGDSALQEALVLTQFCRIVFLIHRGNSFRARQEFIDEVAEHPKIKIVWNATLESIIGTRAVESARLVHKEARVETVRCTGVFVYIGLEPNVDFVPLEVDRDPNGFVATGEDFVTSLPYVSAIGAVRSGYSGQIPGAVFESQKASEAVARRLRSR